MRLQSTPRPGMVSARAAGMCDGPLPSVSETAGGAAAWVAISGLPRRTLWLFC